MPIIIHIFYIPLLVIVGYLMYRNNRYMHEVMARMIEADEDMNQIWITKCDNGYRCSYEENVVKGDIVVKRKREVLFDDVRDKYGQLEAMRKLLIFARNHFGEYWHEERGVNIGIELTTKDINTFDRLNEEDRQIVKEIYKKYL